LALLGAVPADTAAAVFQQSLERDVTATAGLVLVLPWWFSRRDTAALARFASLCDSLALHDSVPLLKAVRHYGAQAARGYAILARGDSAAALRVFASLPDSVCEPMIDRCRFQKLIQARLLGAIGEYGRSFELMEKWTGLDPEVVLEQARLAERLGEREQAIKAYQFVADAWRHADLELQPYVGEAQSRLAQLLAE
jgi:tetratricopeptide (TPR) repeat protein